MNDNIKKIIIVIFIIVLIIIGIAFYYILNDNNNFNSSSSSTEAITNVEETNDITIQDDIDFSGYTTEIINLEKSITISKEGVYELTGTLENGSITINTKGNVKLILNNVTINNNSGAAIVIEEADVTYIELVGDNKITANVNDEVDAAIYSSDDLLLLGDGKLNVTSNMDGIASKDDLMIISGTYNINSEDDGIRGKDSLYIKNGTYNITSNGDGLKTTNEEKGSLYIENGTFNINSYLDAVASITTITIKNGTYNIISGKNNNSTSDSTKGIKAVSNILIENGIFNITSIDDAIHSNSAIEIKDGEFNISSNDDGMHADNTINIKGGKINISKSYEGIEANYIIIDSGTINVVSSDDGINVSGGSNQTGNNRVDEFVDNGGYLKINGGTINVNSQGDGLDSNGSIYITNGYVCVDGPTNSGNGSLDYNGEFIISGGTLIAVGSSGMAENVSSNSTQNTIQINLNSSTSGTIEFASISYTPSKSYQNIIISSSSLELNKEYELIINGNLYDTYTLTQTITSSNNSNQMNPNQMMQGGMRR